MDLINNMLTHYNVSDIISAFLFKKSSGEFRFHLAFWPNDLFDPRNIIGHSGVDARCVLIAAIFPERRYADLSMHTRVV